MTEKKGNSVWKLYRNQTVIISILLISLSIITICSKMSHSYSIISGHPRIFVNDSSLQEIRNKIASSYINEYQLWINDLDSSFDVTSSLSSSNKRYMAMNYSFAYLIMSKATGINGINYGHTATQYLMKAEELINEFADAVISNPTDQGVGQDAFNAGYVLTLSAVYDWTFAGSSVATKNKIVNALVALYESRSSSASNPARAIWNIGIGDLHNPVIGGLAIYGDGINDLKASEMVAKWDTEWAGNVIPGTNFVASNDGGWHEGNHYLYVSIMNMLHPIAAFKTATGEDFFAGSSIIRYLPVYLSYNMKPFPISGNAFKRDVVRYNNMREYEDNFPDYYIYILCSHAGLYKNIDGDMAGLSKYLLDNYAGNIKQGTGYVRQWYLFRYFIWGDKNVVAKSPVDLGLPLSKFYQGIGSVYMRSGFSSDSDTLALFSSPPFYYQYHFNYIPNSFSIEKFGNLAVRSGRKDSSNITYGRTAISSNTVIVYDPNETFFRYSNSSWNDGGTRTSYPSFSDWRQLTRGSQFDWGGIKTTKFENGRYDYIRSDATRAYNSTLVTDDYRGVYNSPKISLFEREFVYIRQGEGIGEYFVVFDRVNSTNASFKKRWLLHSGFEPVVSGTPTVIRQGKTEYSGNVVAITNTLSGAHGRLFSKTLMPENFRISKIGGGNSAFEDAAGNLMDSYTFGSAGFSADMDKNYIGEWRVEVESRSGNMDDQFLHVIEVGDSNSLTLMTPTEKIQTAAVAGAHIKDSRKNIIVLFSSDRAGSDINGTFQYSFFPIINDGNNRRSRHYIFNVRPYQVYSVTQTSRSDGSIDITCTLDPSGNVTSSPEGVMTFEMGDQSIIKYPLSPQNLRIN